MPHHEHTVTFVVDDPVSPGNPLITQRIKMEELPRIGDEVKFHLRKTPANVMVLSVDSVCWSMPSHVKEGKPTIQIGCSVVNNPGYLDYINNYNG